MGNPVQLTEQQFQQLLAAVARPVEPPVQGNGGAGMVAGAASIVGEMPPCHLGKDRLRRYKKWRDWLQNAENKMNFLRIENDLEKLNFIRSCAGAELTTFWEKEARIRFTEVHADQERGIEAADAHTYGQVLEESKRALLTVVSRDRAVIELLRMEQGSRNFMDFLAEVEDQEYICRVDERPITGDDLKRMSLIAGMKDRTLAEKAMAEEYSLADLVKAAITRESSRANADAMRARPTSTVNRVAEEDSTIHTQLQELKKEMEVMRVRQSGKYSRRYKPPDTPPQKKPCQKCNYHHDDQRKCPADGKRCNACTLEGHFARSPLCKVSTKRSHTMRRVDDDESSDSGKDEVVARIERTWPGVQQGTKVIKDMYFVGSEDRQISKPGSKYVTLEVGGKPVELFCDTGSKYTIIPPHLYSSKMGKLAPADCHLRAWGASTHLDTKGMIHTTLRTQRGACTKTKVYIVAGTRPEPLLGATDAENLGIIRFNPQGRSATAIDQTTEVKRIADKSKCITAKLCHSGVPVQTTKVEDQKVEVLDRREALRIIEQYNGTVFSENIGCMNIPPVKLQYEAGFKPVQPPPYPIPYHYRAKTAEHIVKLKQEGVIEDVDPSEPIDCVLNTTISEKKTVGAIRMNIDARPINKGAKHTKYHVSTPQEVRHELKGSKVFTELDMVCGFHQLPLSPESQIVFQTHLGIHRMKRLFFGPKNSSGIFHHEVQKAFQAIPGVITIHDNVLIHAPDVRSHNIALEATLKRARDIGVTFKKTEATVCESSVKWFGRVYMAAGVTTDPEKIETICGAGRPESIQDVKSLLQAAAYNAKFLFDHNECMSYEEATAPLRQLLNKNAIFSWNAEREHAYQVLIRMLQDRSILVPFKVGRPTHLVTDASAEGIAASVYQADDGGRWLPVDHASRALSHHERTWDSQIEWESLGKMWGMTTFRPYLIGEKFTSWGDHKPLVPLYNDFTKPASARIAKHRSKVTDLTFVDKYLPGKKMPADYYSRHPAPIQHLNVKEREADMIDDGEDILIMRVILDDTPPALTLAMLQTGAKHDPIYQRLITAVQTGKKPEAGDPELSRYTAVWEELSVIEGLVCRGERIVIPNGRIPGDDGTLQEWVVDLGHSGHMGMSATKRLLRHRLWFPGMDRMVEHRVTACLPCQAATDNHTRDPLHPNIAPEQPWSTVYTDHWGPTPDKRHILVLIDALTKYPEVISVTGTSAEENIHGFAEAFARHGVPHKLRSDKGPPFNGIDTHLLQRWFKNIGVDHRPNLSAEDPEASGQVESFMKHIKKIFHVATVEGTDPYMKLQEHLLQVRATPHPTTGKCPAELLFGRTFRTTIPDLLTNPASSRQDIIEARAEEHQKKEAIKKTVDSKANTRPHNIKVGDSVLLKQKSTKLHPTYDPSPYKVINIWGTQIEATRDGATKTRDAQRWKAINISARKQYNKREQKSTYHTDPDIGLAKGQTTHDLHNPAILPAVIPGAGQNQELQENRGHNLQPAALDHNEALNQQLRNDPVVILPATPANRTTRTRRPVDRYRPS